MLKITKLRKTFEFPPYYISTIEDKFKHMMYAVPVYTGWDFFSYLNFFISTALKEEEFIIPLLRRKRKGVELKPVEEGEKRIVNIVLIPNTTTFLVLYPLIEDIAINSKSNIFLYTRDINGLPLVLRQAKHNTVSPFYDIMQQFTATYSRYEMNSLLILSYLATLSVIKDPHYEINLCMMSFGNRGEISHTKIKNRLYLKVYYHDGRLLTDREKYWAGLVARTYFINPNHSYKKKGLTYTKSLRGLLEVFWNIDDKVYEKFKKKYPYMQELIKKYKDLFFLQMNFTPAKISQKK